jgi:hypothetical protein
LRYELGFLLGVVVAATACAGHDEVAAQAQWAADAPVGVLRALGAKPDPLTGTISTPSEATLRRALANLDATDLQRLRHRVGRGPAGERRGRRERRAARGGHRRQVRTRCGRWRQPPPPPAVRGHPRRRDRDRPAPDPGDKGSEIGELAALVAELDLAGTVVTVDALCRSA